MAQGNRFLILSLGDEHYAVPIAKLVEITAMRSFNRDPHASGSLEGTCEFRGQTIPVLNLKKTLDLPGRSGNTLLVVKGKKDMFGLLTDAVADILDTAQKPIPMPKNVVSGKVRWYGGVLRYKDSLALLLNEDELLP